MHTWPKAWFVAPTHSQTDGRDASVRPHGAVRVPWMLMSRLQNSEHCHLYEVPPVLFSRASLKLKLLLGTHPPCKLKFA